MKKYKTLCVALPTLLFSSVLIAGTANIKDTISKCNQSIEEGNASKALNIADEALRNNPNHHDALLCKGRAYASLKQFPAAVTALQASEESSANSGERMVSLLLMGNVQKEAGQSAEAMGSYQKSLDIARGEKDQPFERVSLNQLGETQVDAGQTEAGLQNYLKASELAANDNERGESYARIASAYDKLDKRNEAIEYQIKAMMMQERAGERDAYANAGLELGRLYTVAKDYIGAEKAINRILKFAQDHGSAYWEARANYYLGLTKAEQGETDAARTLMLQAHQAARQIGATSMAGEIGNAMLKLPNK
jgi:tetratricopeptide (TPR) repeat protein